jgi:hypothetical protein
LTPEQFYRKHYRIYYHHAEVFRSVHELFPSLF